MNKFFSRFICAVLVVFLLAGCLSPDQHAITSDPLPWLYGSLRLLDAIDAPAPEQDIVAAYARTNAGWLELRLDLLDLRSEIPASDLYITVDTLPGGNMALPLKDAGVSTAEVMLRIPAREPARAVRANGNQIDNTGLQITRDARLDMLTIRLNADAVGGSPRQFSFQAFLTSPGSPQVIDSTVAFSLDSTPPRRAPLLLAFWNTLPAATPAQALRRWDGAHTGPAGRRHGLRHILGAVEKYRVPVVLLDLKTPASLAALDLLDGLAQVQNLAARELLLLPDVLAGDSVLAARSLETNRAVAQNFGIQQSPFFYGTGALPPSEHIQAVFTGAEFPNGLAVHNGIHSISLAGAAMSDQLTTGGLSLSARTLLLNAATSAIPPLTVLGGSLPSSNWGDLVTAIPAFEYIAAHPWIQPWGAQEIRNAPLAAAYSQPADCANLLCLDEITVPPDLREDLEAWLSAPQTVPDSRLRALALQSYLELTRPAADPQRIALQQYYLPDLSYLIHAGRWANNPYETSACGLDLNRDAIPECVLSDQNVFTVIEPEHNSVILAVWMNRGVAEPGVMPSSYLAVGLSDPSEWQLEPGQPGDASIIRGAFSQTLPAGISFTTRTAPGTVQITWSNGEITHYSLQERTLIAEFDRLRPFTMRIPLAAGSTARTTPAWKFQYSGQTTADQTAFSWRASSHLTLSVQASAGTLTSQTWLDSINGMRLPEDPDHAYPPGHFLPYPLAILDLQAAGATTVRIAPLP